MSRQKFMEDTIVGDNVDFMVEVVFELRRLLRIVKLFMVKQPVDGKQQQHHPHEYREDDQHLYHYMHHRYYHTLNRD